MATTIAQLRGGIAEQDGGGMLRGLLEGRSFDPDAWHVMQERDNDLIRSELMHGSGSRAFVYDFKIKDTRVTGISVIGARELASQYKGIKSRFVATIEKRGPLFIFRTFTPLSIETRVLFELADDIDYYECVMEVSDIKTGNSVEVRKKELKTENKRDGGTFDRPHYDVICESKAFRNGVLSVLPQSVIQDFKKRCLEAGNVSEEKTVQQLRASIAAHAAKFSIALDRNALGKTMYEELVGLAVAAKGSADQFKSSAMALGLVAGVDRETGEATPPPPPPPPPPLPPAAGVRPTDKPAPTPAPPPATNPDLDNPAGSWGDDTSGPGDAGGIEMPGQQRTQGQPTQGQPAATPAATTARRPRATLKAPE